MLGRLVVCLCSLHALLLLLVAAEDKWGSYYIGVEDIDGYLAAFGDFDSNKR